MLAIVGRRLNLNLSKTYLKMIAFISIAMLVLSLSLIQFLYREFEDIGLEHAHELNSKLSSQLTFNFDYMNEFVKNAAITQFFDPSNVQIMQQGPETEDSFNLIRNLTKLQNVMANNSFLHSAVIYNNRQHELYTIDSQGVAPSTPEFLEMVKRGRQVPVLTPIPGILNEDGNDIPVFSYYLFDSVDQAGTMDGSLILNVKMDWLLDNLRKFMTDDDSNVVLVDANGDVLLDARNEYRQFDRVEKELLEVETNRSTIMEIGHGDQVVVTKLSVLNTEGWHLICIRSYASVFGFLDELRSQIALVACTAFVIAIAASLAISKIIYRPFGLLVQKVKQTMGEHDLPTYDDTEYLSRTLQFGITRYHQMSLTSRELIKENVLKGLLTGSHPLQGGVSEEQLAELSEWFMNSGPFRLFALTIDQNKLYRELVPSEMQLVKFSIMNVANEIAREYGPFEKAYLGNGEFVYLVADRSEASDDLHVRIKQMQTVVAKIAQSITISAVIGPRFERIDELHSVYSVTRSLLNYRLSQGNGCVLRRDDFVENRMDEGRLVEAETKMSDAIKRGRPEEAWTTFQSFAAELRNSDNNRLLVAMVSLALSIGRTVQEINLNKRDDIRIDFARVYADIVQAESLDEISGRFRQLFDQLKNEQRESADSKHDAIISLVTEYIQLHYAEDDLSLKQIASELKMSNGYLGQLFRESRGKSVAKYINDVRMEKVCYLLRATDWNVREIALKTGFLNEANFYKVFKKEFGVTPVEYRTNWTLGRIHPDPGK